MAAAIRAGFSARVTGVASMTAAQPSAEPMGAANLTYPPEVVIAGRYTVAGEFVVVGRTVVLSAAQSAELGAVLKSAGRDHPWPDEISWQRWGGRGARKPLTKVEPLVVIDVLADAAMQAGQWRHGLRYARYRPDLTPDDVPTLPASAAT